MDFVSSFKQKVYLELKWRSDADFSITSKFLIPPKGGGPLPHPSAAPWHYSVYVRHNPLHIILQLFWWQGVEEGVRYHFHKNKLCVSRLCQASCCKATIPFKKNMTGVSSRVRMLLYFKSQHESMTVDSDCQRLV